MRRCHVVTSLSLVLAFVAPSWGSDGEITIVAELAGTGRSKPVECDFWVMKWNRANQQNGKTPFGSCRPVILKVYANLQGASAGGITGAEFGVRIGPDRMPDPGYLLVEMPNSSARISIGSAFTPPDADTRGLNLAWTTCQSGNDGRVLLETIMVIPTVPCGPNVSPPTLSLRVGQHWWPSHRFMRCPLFTLCDAPAFTKVCLGTDEHWCDLQVPPFTPYARCSSSGSFVINGKGGPGRCGKGKPEADVMTWGGVKALYR